MAEKLNSTKHENLQTDKFVEESALRIYSSLALILNGIVQNELDAFCAKVEFVDRDEIENRIACLFIATAVNRALENLLALNTARYHQMMVNTLYSRRQKPMTPEQTLQPVLDNVAAIFHKTLVMAQSGPKEPNAPTTARQQ